MGRLSSTSVSIDLHALIKESANAVHRSLNSQIIWLLETGLAARDKRDV